MLLMPRCSPVPPTVSVHSDWTVSPGTIAVTGPPPSLAANVHAAQLPSATVSDPALIAVPVAEPSAVQNASVPAVPSNSTAAPPVAMAAFVSRSINTPGRLDPLWEVPAVRRLLPAAQGSVSRRPYI